MPVEPRFDPVIHEPMRLRICGILSTADEMQFAALRDTLDISDAACSKHLKVLVDCGYATVEKRESDSSRHMVRWYALTSAGERRLLRPYSGAQKTRLRTALTSPHGCRQLTVGRSPPA